MSATSLAKKVTLPWFLTISYKKYVEVFNLLYHDIYKYF